ncbi:MAG: hypothetical protein NZ822_01010 [Patescibacteria group bacterium]|nr:hypothetical protein [Patescibacteria group bacterium]
MKKGFTYIELLIVLGVLILLLGILISVIGAKPYFAKSRDVQRLKDLYFLNLALNFYFQNATSVDPDGPYLYLRGIDEATPTIFVSIPKESYPFPATYTTGSITYYYYQSNRSDYQRIDGYGWLPINFMEISFPSLAVLPVDPLNQVTSSLYYTYSFRRSSFDYEIGGSFETAEFKNGGVNDKVSTDGGNDPNRYELGSNLNLIPPL